MQTQREKGTVKMMSYLDADAEGEGDDEDDGLP